MQWPKSPLGHGHRLEALRRLPELHGGLQGGERHASRRILDKGAGKRRRELSCCAESIFADSLQSL